MLDSKEIITPDKPLIQISDSMRSIIEHLRVLGNKAVVIGGAVRDALLGIEPKDIDLEIYGIPYNALEEFLSRYGKVDLVGKSFGIIKFRPDGEDQSYDISIPRRENKVGVGHRDFEATLDPFMSMKEAATRRDFTFNALAYDPIENKIYDYFGGVNDLKNKIIRHTSEAFKEDALRILRCFGFQARFGFEVHPDTIQAMKEILATGEFEALPKERVFEEWMKWLEKGIRHDQIFKFMRDTGLVEYYPELNALKETQQDKIYHPEGDVEIHTTLCLSVMDKIIEREKITGEEKAILVMALLLHDIGKPATTEEQMKNGRMTITSHGHEALGASMAKEFLSRIGFHESLITPIANIVADHLAGVNIMAIKDNRGRVKAVKKLSRRLNPATIKQLTYIMEADHNGRGSDTYKEPTGSKEILAIASEINVQDKPYQYILMGRHLIEAGLEPSPEFGQILRRSYEAQENGEFQDLEGAKKWLHENLQHEAIKTRD